MTFKAAPEDFPQKHKAPILNIGIAETGTAHKVVYKILFLRKVTKICLVNVFAAHSVHCEWGDLFTYPSYGLFVLLKANIEFISVMFVWMTVQMKRFDVMSVAYK